MASCLHNILFVGGYMTKMFEGKVALVTGGASGIGRATAIAFGREGAKVCVADVNEQGGEETVNLITEAGGEAFFIRCDVSKASEVETMIERSAAQYGRLDCAFNNAGIDIPGTTADCTEADWDLNINIDLKGVWLCMKYEIPQMLKQGGGAIVNTSSAAGLIGTPGIAAYTAAKHGVIGLTRTAALEYAKAGIRVNAVCPGTVDVPGLREITKTHPELSQSIIDMHPIGRIGTVEEIAEPVLWLCSDAASFITGLAMAVDGGVTV
jgi:NAD(P)-dependent dehydrogenase (short-subunit alcohol dehydrogenase family)